MLKNTSSLFLVLATAANSNPDKRLTTGIRKIIKDHEKTFGERTSLKFTRQALKGFIDKGFFLRLPDPPCRDLISIFNKPMSLLLTKKGISRLADSAAPDKTLDDMSGKHDPDPCKVYGWPKDMPRLDMMSKSLPIRPAAILKTLVGACTFYKKQYCYLSQETIRKRAFEWEGIKISNGSLNRWLAWLERSGWIDRQQRGRYGKDGNPSNKSTLYYLAEKAWNWIRKMTTWLRKFTATLRLPNLGDYPLQRTIIIPGPTEKGGASPVIFSDSQREANLLRLRKLASGIFT